MKNPLKTAIILPVIVLGAVAAVFYAVKSKPALDHEALSYPTRTVDVFTARRLPFRSRAMGYGYVEPTVMLKAKSEVAGKVSYVHPALAKGGTLPKGTVALRIDSTAFELSVDESKAALAGSVSTLAQLEVEQKSTRASLAIAKKNLDIGERELARITNLWKKAAIARTAVDAEEQKVLLLTQQIEELEGRIAAYSSRRSASKAQIDQSKSRLAKTADTLERTEVRLPFDARIGTVYVEEGEFVSTGSVVFEALGTNAVEIEAQLPTRRLRALFVSSGSRTTAPLSDSSELASALTAMDLEARVRLVGADGNSGRWDGTAIRISESVDPTHDTIGIVVTVPNPYSNVVPGERPPLLNGMYASVEFVARASEQLVVPTAAVHEGRVYVAVPGETESSYTLEIRPVEVDYRQGELIVLRDGVAPGERLVLTDVVPVVDGMPLEPREVDGYEARLADAAAAVDDDPVEAPRAQQAVQ